MEKPHLKIADYYKECFDKHGDNHLGVNWPNKEDMIKRYKIGLYIIR